MCVLSLPMAALFFFSSRRRHTRYIGDWSSDVCSSDLVTITRGEGRPGDYVEAYGPPSVVMSASRFEGEIGRASCRERVEMAVEGGAVRKEWDRDVGCRGTHR